MRAFNVAIAAFPVLLLSSLVTGDSDKSHKEAGSMPSLLEVATVGHGPLSFGVDAPSLEGGDTGELPTGKNDAIDELLDDAKILAVAHAANAAEIEQAQLAKRRGSDTRVRRLASMILKHHQAAQVSETHVIRRRNLDLSESATSNQLESEDREVMGMLATKSGPEFDRAYLDAQVNGHREVLGLIDNRLLPSVLDGEVRTLVVGLRPAVASHLQQAEMLRSDLKHKE